MLSSLLLFQSAGWYLCHYFQVRQVRYEMKQWLKHDVPEEDRIVLRIHRSMQKGHPDFKRMDKREIRYKGEMYDILKEEVRGDETWYTCIHDVKESGLFKQLDELVNFRIEKDPEERKHRSLMQALFSKQFVDFATDKIRGFAENEVLRICYIPQWWDDIAQKPWKPPRILSYIFN